MHKAFNYLLYGFFICAMHFASAQTFSKLSFEFGYGNHLYSMENYNRYYIDSSGSKFWGFKEGISKGMNIAFGLKYKPVGLFDIGISGNYQSGKTTGQPEFIEYDDMGQYVATHTGTFTFKAEAIGIGISSAWYIDHVLKFQEKKGKFISRSHIAIDLYGGIGFSQMTSDLRFPTLSASSGNYKIYSSNQDFQGQIALRLEYDYVKSPVIGSIGIKGGYQYFKTKTLQDRLGKEWIVTGNHPINIDFSGFFGTVFLTVGK